MGRAGWIRTAVLAGIVVAGTAPGSGGGLFAAPEAGRRVITPPPARIEPLTIPHRVFKTPNRSDSKEGEERWFFHIVVPDSTRRDIAAGSPSTGTRW